jgi:2-dehydro-3-deoxyphosphogluconate aldolase / (4S)-4-hydroxy-2-oxoglutarate aldolase
MTSVATPSGLDRELDDALSAHRAVAILRAAHSRHLLAAAEALNAEGFRVLEFPLTTPGALDAIRAARRRLAGEALVGAGTVLTADDARAAVEAGAQLLVSPALCPEAVAVGIQAGVAVLPGAFTPTEILAAEAAGARLVKLFPTAMLGPEYLAALRQPLPDIRIIPTGGVCLANARGWLAAGAAALGLGSPLTGDSLETGELDALRESARTWFREIAAP